MGTESGIDRDYLLEIANDHRASVRADLGVQLAHFISEDTTNEADRAAAGAVLLILANDTVLTVRKSLAQAVVSSPFVSREVLRALVCDNDEVSLPVLEKSPVMSEADLASVVKAGPKTRQIAIAQREKVGTRLAQVIIETCDEDVCTQLLNNPGSMIDKAGFEELLERHGESEVVVEAISRRGDAPVHIIAKLVVDGPNESDEPPMLLSLVQSDSTTDTTIDTRIDVIMGLVRDTDTKDLRDLVTQLHDSEALTASLILKASFVGRMSFVVEAISILSGVPAKRVNSLLLGKARLGARAIYLRAGLPPSSFRAFRVALDVYSFCRGDGEVFEESLFGRRIIEHIATDHEDIVPEDRKYLLKLLAALGAEDSQELAGQLASRLAEAA